MMIPDSLVQHSICTNKEEKSLFEFQLLKQAKLDYKHSKINAFLVHKNTFPILFLLALILLLFDKNRLFLGLTIKHYIYILSVLMICQSAYQIWIDYKIKQKIKPENEKYTYFSSTGIIRKIISHMPKKNLIEFEIEYLNRESQIQTRIFKHFYQIDIFNPDDFNDRESAIYALINQSVILYLSSESETLLQLYLKDHELQNVKFKPSRFFFNCQPFWLFTQGPLPLPIVIHPDDLHSIEIQYLAQSETWSYIFKGQIFEDIYLLSQIENIHDFELALSSNLADFDHQKHKKIKLSKCEYAQQIWQNPKPLNELKKTRKRKKLAIQFTSFQLILIFTSLWLAYPFKDFFHISFAILFILITSILMIFIYMYLCRHFKYMITTDQVALFQIHPRTKGGNL